MGVDTRAKLLGRVKPEEIVNYIYYNWDKNVKSNIRHDDMNKLKNETWINETYSDELYSEYGRIDFEYKDESRSLFYCYDSYNIYENLEYYKEYGLEQMVKAETTYLSLGKWGSSVDILKELCEYFNGYLDENDCDDEEYYYIESKQEDRKVKMPPVIYMTQEELNQHFGGIVVIKEKQNLY